MSFGEGYTNRATLFVFGYMLIAWLYYYLNETLNYLHLGLLAIIWFILPDIFLYFYHRRIKYSMAEKWIEIEQPYMQKIQIKYSRLFDVMVINESKKRKSLYLRYLDKEGLLVQKTLFNIEKHEEAIKIIEQHKKVVRHVEKRKLRKLD